MNFYSTKNKDIRVSFKDAVFNSLPEDRGLYMPEEIRKVDPLFLRNIHQYSFPEIAFEVANTLLDGEINKEDLKKIIDETLNFDAPVRLLESNLAVLELFHGPSYAFKDFGARFMSRVMSYLAKGNNQLLDVLVATSGDTGGAVALGFLGVPGTRVTILYPKGKVSEVQKQQLTTNGKNIRAIELDGTFDDCQELVKKAFNDKELNQKMQLTSANSINIARLIPQSFYYFYAYAQLRAQGAEEVVFSVPSGNFGNIAAGVLARKMGLPIKHFVAANNSNDTVFQFLNGGEYTPKASVQTLSNAMDVGNPSNWERIVDLYNGDTDSLKKDMSSFRFNDEETLEGIKELFDKYGYIACPHTAVAYNAIKAYNNANTDSNYASVFLSTAHPIKFPEAFTKEMYEKIEAPEGTLELAQKKQKFLSMKNSYERFKAYLVES